MFMYFNCFRWKAGHHKLKDGLLTGPLVMFDKAGNAMVMSPFNHFMSANMYHDTKQSMLSWGIMGKIDAIPAGHSMKTIAYFSDKGINQVNMVEPYNEKKRKIPKFKF